MCAFSYLSQYVPCPLPSGCLAVRYIHFTPSPELQIMKQPEKRWWKVYPMALIQKQCLSLLWRQIKKISRYTTNSMNIWYKLYRNIIKIMVREKKQCGALERPQTFELVRLRSKSYFLSDKTLESSLTRNVTEIKYIHGKHSETNCWM